MKVKITRNEGWFSEQELKSELKWSAWGPQFINWCSVLVSNSIKVFTQNISFFMNLYHLHSFPGSVLLVSRRCVSKRPQPTYGLVLSSSILIPINPLQMLACDVCQVQPLWCRARVLGGCQRVSRAYGIQDHWRELPWDKEGNIDLLDWLAFQQIFQSTSPNPAWCLCTGSGGTGRDACQGPRSFSGNWQASGAKADCSRC